MEPKWRNDYCRARPVGLPCTPVPTRVLLVDDHAVVRAGIRLVLEQADGIDVVGEAGTEERAVALARAHKPDVIVLDVLLPGEGGLALIPQLEAVSPTSQILMLSAAGEPGTVRQALDAGATGYSLKKSSDADLLAAVRTVAEGTSYVHPEIGAQLAGLGRRSDLGPLSPRERDVLRLVALGHTNQEISEQLFISTRTAEMHRASIMRKLHFETRAQLVNYALANGLIGPS
jgi:two-component system, NarL family, response regulator NreC